MTFAEYNTDEYFNNSDSTAEGLVKAGYDEGKTRKEIEDSLSPLWKEDKKGNVKKALDTYYKTETAPEAEAKEEIKETVTETPKTEAPKATDIKQKSSVANRQNEDSMTQEQIEYQNQLKNKEQAWNNTLDTIDRQKDAFNKIDDRLVAQLSTFMFKRYANGEFGDPKSSDAKLRLAHFMLNGVQSKLKLASNLAMANAGKSPMFSDTQSDWDKFQESNLAKGMENRWKKYDAETEAAIELAKQRGTADEDLNETIAKISSNNRLQTSFNRMNEEQKAYSLQVMAAIGKDLGSMSDEDFANTLFSLSAMGESLDYKEAAAMLVYRFIKDPEKRDAALSRLGFGDMSGGLLGGLGNALTGGSKDEEDTGVTLDDGTKVDPGKTMNKKELEEIRATAKKLGDQFYEGKLTEEEFRKEYSKLEDVMKQHGVREFISGGILSQDDYIKQIRTNKRTELSDKIDALNKQAKSGTIKPSDYEEKFKALREDAVKWGASEKDLKSIDKGKVKEDTILKAAEKAAKKKK